MVRSLVVADIQNVNMAVAGTHIFNFGPVAGGTKFMPYQLLLYGVTSFNQVSAEQSYSIGEASAYTNLGDFEATGQSGLQHVVSYTGRTYLSSVSFDTNHYYTEPRGTIVTMPSPLGVKIYQNNDFSGTVHFFLWGWFL